MTRSMRIDDLEQLVVPSQPAFSPDGRRLVYVARGHDLEADAAVTSLWIIDGSNDPRPLTHGKTDAAPAWSPSGSMLAFTRDSQVWVLPADGGEATQLTTLPLGAGAPVWSPDSTTIAFSSLVDAAAVEGEDDKAREQRSAAPIVIDDIFYQMDGFGFVREMRMQVHVVDVATKSIRQITHGREHATNPTWSPDGAMLAYTAKPTDYEGLDFRNAVHLIDATSAEAKPEVVAFHEGYAGTVTYSPDGRRLVVAGYLGDLRGHARLYAVDLSTGATVDLAPELDRNVMPGAPAYPGALPTFVDNDVLFAIRDRGCTHLYRVPLDGGPAKHVFGGDGDVVSGLSVAEHKLALALGTPTSFGEIVVLSLGVAHPVTSHGNAEIALAARTSREFTISDGTTVQAWIMRSPTATGPGPLLVDIHGGPHNAWNSAADEMHLYHYELVAQGWTVLIVNPRGSDGYGEKFYDGVHQGWGIADANDFLEPVDTLVAEGIADPDRLAVTGYSYGGYMTCYLTATDQRFAAAVPGGVVSDLTSIGGTSDDAHLLSVLEIGALPWQDRDELARMSPYSYVDRVTTPTLVLHGADDVRCPIGQAEQWHYALAERGVPTRMVLYPGASHIFILAGRPSHRMDYYRRVIDWVERYANQKES